MSTDEHSSQVSIVMEEMPPAAREPEDSSLIMPFDGEGEVKQMFPGWIWNGRKEAWLRTTDNPVKLHLFETRNSDDPVESIDFANVEAVEASKRNDYVFKVIMRESPEKKHEYFFKVNTTTEDRDRWVRFLQPKVPIPPKQAPAVMKKEGHLRELYPGYIYNGREDVWLRVVDAPTDDEEPHLALQRHESDTAPFDKINVSNIAEVAASKRNDYVFKIILKAPTISGKKDYFLKVLTDSTDRDAWVATLKYLFF